MNCVELHGHWSRLKPWRRLHLHKNPGLEIVLITKGEFEWEVDGRPEIIHPNTVFFTLPWQRHGSQATYHPGSELWFVIIRPERVTGEFRLHSELGLSGADNRWVTRTLAESRWHAFPAAPALRTMLPLICRELDGDGPGRLAYVTGLLRAVVVELARTVSQNPPPRSARRDTMETVRQLLPQLEQEMDKRWTLAEMAARCGLKRSQFATRFTELTGDTPITYLNRLRVRHADQLLKTTDHSITDIAFECGFQSSQYFATVYRQFTGKNPGASRKQ